MGKVILENQLVNRRLNSIELVINEYIEYKKDTSKFKKFMEKKYEKKVEEPKESSVKDGVGSRVLDK